MEIKKVAVVGAGAMGHGIGQVAAMAGFEVTLRDVNDELLTGAMEKINWSLNKLVQKNRIAEEDAKKTVDRIKLVVPLEEAVKNVDYVIEAIPEKLNLKRQILVKWINSHRRMRSWLRIQVHS